MTSFLFLLFSGDTVEPAIGNELPTLPHGRTIFSERRTQNECDANADVTAILTSLNLTASSPHAFHRRLQI
ncbi:hypothetical protein BD769DRAFT_1479752 [Suillus cothurnatus]|nr:hypothetical protein BD769DRAFT_1479752 [Suillus cothurnatus]